MLVAAAPCASYLRPAHAEGPDKHAQQHLWQVRDCGSLLTVGGFSIPAVDVDDITIHYKDFKGVVDHLR